MAFSLWPARKHRKMACSGCLKNCLQPLVDDEAPGSNKETKHRWNQATKTYSQATTNAKNKWLTSEAKKVDQMRPDQKGAWEAIFRLQDCLDSHHKSICNTKMRHPNGQLAKTDEESAEILKNFFSDNVFGRTFP